MNHGTNAAAAASGGTSGASSGLSSSSSVVSSTHAVADEGEYVWDITSEMLGFILNEYHVVIEIVTPSSAASMGAISIGDVLICVNDQEKTVTWTEEELHLRLAASNSYPLHVHFQKSNGSEGYSPPRKVRQNKMFFDIFILFSSYHFTRNYFMKTLYIY